MQLNELFQSGVAIPAFNERDLKKSLQEGQNFFHKVNDARLNLAFSMFSSDMKKALFEVLYFLHVNDPRFENYQFQATKIERVSGLIRETQYPATMQLYFPDALHGIASIDKLPQAFHKEFYQYVTSEFDLPPSKDMIADFAPFVSVSSLGSIGTIGHKTQKSDLDLQILYELQPFKLDLSQWSEQRLKEALSQEIHSWVHRIAVQKKCNPKTMKETPKLYKKLHQEAVFKVGRSYPYLYQILFQNKNLNKFLASSQGSQLKMALILEMMELITLAEKQEKSEELLQKENTLKARIVAIQDYIQAKFPHAEVYLFVSDGESFRQGKNGTTLESKEASGSAYELILNYEVLMPGIQFASMIPTHFIFPKSFNNSHDFYEKLVNFIRFGCLPMYSPIEGQLVDMGATPSLKMAYMLTHIGAAYWESFKAASGNLPKALLKLFRIEVLYHPKYLTTLIEFLKTPAAINRLIPQNYKVLAKQQESDSKRRYGISIRQVLELEKKLPLLLIDPWWLQYKILKIFYDDPQIDLEPSERRRISRNIDLCFALHVKLSDGFNLEQAQNHRDRFLIAFLQTAFPEKSPQRHFIESFFMGEVKTLNRFEQDLRILFSNCLDRIHRIIALHDVPDGSNQSEFEIWYHYYQQNFDYAPNEIPKNILTHLKIPRDSIHIHYEKSRRRGSWVFKGRVGKTEATSHESSRANIPQTVDLTYDMSFLKGLTYCIINGYYGLVREGTVHEKKTQLHINLGASDLGSGVDNLWSKIDSETITYLADQIVTFFPYRKNHYMDGVRLQKEVTEIFFFLNLFKFGQLSILFRDNLQRWYIEEFEHHEIVLNAQKYYDQHREFFQNSALNASIKKFLKKNQVNVKRKGLKTAFWYNPMSTDYSRNLDNASRQNMLSWQFQDAFLNKYGQKDEK